MAEETTPLDVLQLTAEQHRRAFIIEHYFSSGDPAAIDGRILVENLHHIEKWMLEGTVPEVSKAQRKKIQLVPQT